MDRGAGDPTRQRLQQVRALTSELYALTVEMGGLAQKLRTAQQTGGSIPPAEAGHASALLGQMTRTATRLREEAADLSPGPALLVPV
jgi:hypothetical protein